MRAAAQAILLLPLFVAYWYVHGQLAMWVMWVPELFTDRSYRSAGLLVAVLLCGFLSGLVFSGPVWSLYQRRAFLAALLVSFGAGAFNAYHMRLEGVRPFTQFLLVADLVVFMLALPAGVLLLQRVRPNSSFKPTSLRDAA